ncbi:MAG: hypothetical protein CVT80_12310 [Alphaproteobacteria bacterium HGW-Alphaproteobacteria-2]|nr:MAG: hypothetical protein CVT80_12310 [Alphaproteobacteria bacterium HGW-Alphaproteobacteria-2]
MSTFPAYLPCESQSLVQFDRGTLTYQVIYSWWHIRRATARLLAAQPDEIFLLMLVTVSTLGAAIAWLIRAVIVPGPDGLVLTGLPLQTLAAVIVGRFIGFYVLSAVLAAACRRAGGWGSDRDTRFAVFWAALVAMPIDVASALTLAALYALAAWFPLLGSAQSMQSFYWIGLLAFVWFLSGTLMQVHMFRSQSRVFLYLSLASLVAVLLALYFWSQLFI